MFFSSLFHHTELKKLWLPIGATAAVVTVSNILVLVPINDWLTWGAFSYPLVFLVTDLTNRRFGVATARKTVSAGFVLAVLIAITLVDLRIGLASAIAYFAGQLLDISIFAALRKKQWWKAPLVSSTGGSAFDSLLFFSLGFAGTGLPWQTWAVGDFGIKMAMAITLLPIYRGIGQWLLSDGLKRV